jgi:acyl-CoA thioesterase I
MAYALIYHVASGRAFFSGAALIVAAVLSTYGPGGRWIGFGRRVAASAGVLLVAASATPLPVWYYALAGLATLAWVAAEASSRAVRRPKGWIRGVLLAIVTLGVAMELPYHVTPTLPPLGHPPVFIVGDSLAAGMGGETVTWPRLLARRLGADVRDLALAGATVGTALRDQAGRIAGRDALVLAEIGGNDVLAGTPPDAFARDLDALLARLRSGGRTVVLLELPLPPFANAYGLAQRRLARKHGVWLVPKRLLLGVLTADGATVDTIHLSRSGHERMAVAIAGVLRPAIADPAVRAGRTGSPGGGGRAGASPGR